MIYKDVAAFYRSYEKKKCVIGYSLCGREIYAMHVGSLSGRQLLAAYAFHGREWITARLALRHIAAGLSGGWGGWIVPLVNPDGAQISSESRPLWKANARGVDINCNFDADWGGGVKNTRIRGAENCIGDYPLSEPESRALARFTEKVMPDAAFAFHTKGEEIYWEFNGRGDERGAAILSAATGYRAVKIEGSAGGYKDWCIQRLNIPAYTVECGADSLQHPVKDVRKLKKCYDALKIFTECYGKKIYEKRP